MRRLLAKHPDGIDGFKEQNDMATDAGLLHPESRPELGLRDRDIPPISAFQPVGLGA